MTKKGDSDEAIKAFDKALKTNPQNPLCLSKKETL